MKECLVKYQKFSKYFGNNCRLSSHASVLSHYNFRLPAVHVKFQLICTLIGSCCLNYINFQLKQYRGVMSHDTEEWCKSEENSFVVLKWKQFGKFLPEHSKVSKICTLNGFFWGKYITFDLTFDLKYMTFELSLMTLKRDAKFEEKQTIGSKNNMRNLANFQRVLEGVKIGTLMGFFCPN